MPNSFTCPHCGAQQSVEPGAGRGALCAACGRPLYGQAVAPGAPARAPVVLPVAEEEEPLRGEPPPLPGSVKAAGIIWIVFGGLVLLNGGINVLLQLAVVPRGGPGAGGMVTGAVCGGLFVALIGGVFIHVGVQSLNGTAKDTLGNGIGSIIFAALIGGLGLITLVVAGVAGVWWAVLAAVINLLAGAGLLAAGVLALVGRDGYKRWRHWRNPPPARRSRDYR